MRPRHTSSNVLIVLALLLAFAGQTLAAAAACTMMDTAAAVKMSANSDHDAYQGHTMHKGHTMHSEDTSSPAPATEKCCKTDGSCPMSSCMQAGVIVNPSVTAAVPYTSEKIQIPNSTFASASMASLYRPPISR